MNFLNKHKYVYLIVGIVFFIAGIIVEVYYESVICIWKDVISHFLLIFGEALAAFYVINVVLEHETKEKFLSETKTLITDQERQILASFDGTALKLVEKTNNLFNDLNKDIFRVILQERTSAEIAKEINQDDFFKSGFLKTYTDMKYKFLVDVKDSAKIEFLQEDVFIVKNIAKEKSDYLMTLTLTSPISKKFSFLNAGYTFDCEGEHYTDLGIDMFDVQPIPNLKSGNNYKLKKALEIEPGKRLKIYRNIKAEFIDYGDGIDDYFFTKQYMLPFILTVSVPEGYEFNLYPTFPQNKLNGPYKSRNNILYDIPFLFPGQGFSFALCKNGV